MSEIYKKLMEIQSDLKAPKNQLNKFGNYKYRSCEDILEAVKPLLLKHGLILIINDFIQEIGGRVYVRATVKLLEADMPSGHVVDVSATAYAREEETKKGMDASQITGAASSYARKYALNGLFLIDDTKDADSTNTHGNTASKEKSISSEEAIKRLNECVDLAALQKTFMAFAKEIKANTEVIKTKNEMKIKLTPKEYL